MNSTTFTSGFYYAYCLPTRTKSLEPAKTLPKLSIALISRTALRVAVCCPHSEYFIVTMMTLAATKTEPKIELRAKLVPPEYPDYLLVFSETEACALPPRCYIDHTISLVDGSKPPFGHMYLMLDVDLKKLKQWIEDNLSIEIIYMHIYILCSITPDYC